jgi:hypothetical protein
MNDVTGVNPGRIEKTPNGGDWTKRHRRLLQVPRYYPAPGRPQISSVHKNEPGTFRNDRDERREKTRPNIPESGRAWCDARACFRSGDTSCQGGR